MSTFLMLDNFFSPDMGTCAVSELFQSRHLNSIYLKRDLKHGNQEF